MTPEERNKPDLVSQSRSRRERISKGSGRPYQEVNALVKRFEDMRHQLKALSNMNLDGLDPNKVPQNMKNMMQPTQRKSRGKGKGRGNFRF